MIEKIFPILGIILTNIFGLNILRSYIINRNKLTYEYNEIQFYLIIFTGCMWLLYGVIVRDIFIFLSNIIPIISSFGFIQIMYKYIKHEKIIYIEIISIFGLFYLLTIIFLLNFTTVNINNISIIVGISCSILTIIVNIAPLLIIKQVVTTLNTELIYLPQIFINSINHLCWFIYGIFNYNIFLLISNCISLILCLIQLAVYIYVKIKINNNILPTNSSN